MKKFLAILMAAMMVLCASAVAEATAPEEITVELDETYVQVDLGEAYAFTYLPADWLTVAPESFGDLGLDESVELLGYFMSADGATKLVVTYATTETPATYDDYMAAATANGQAAQLGIFNGFEFVCIGSLSEDQTQINMACHFIPDDAGSELISFTFVYAADNADMEPVMNQVLGGFNFYEA